MARVPCSPHSIYVLPGAMAGPPCLQYRPAGNTLAGAREAGQAGDVLALRSQSHLLPHNRLKSHIPQSYWLLFTQRPSPQHCLQKWTFYEFLFHSLHCLCFPALPTFWSNAFGILISFLLLFVCCLMVCLYAFYSYFALLFVVTLGGDLNGALARFNQWLNSVCVVADVHHLKPENSPLLL